MEFHVIDKKTGKEADTYNIALNEEWAKHLIYCDMDGFFIGEDGALLLTDECGNSTYPDPERFEIVWDEYPEGWLGDNYVSREAVIEWLKGQDIIKTDWQEANARKQLRELPSVAIPSKTVHWISDAIQGEIDGQIVKAFTCSKCGAISVFRMAEGKIVNGDLCPSCGARMVEP